MTYRIQQIFQHLEPSQVLQNIGVPISIKEGRMYVPNPGLPDKWMVLDKQEFVSIDDGCPIVACDIFGYLSFHLGSCEQAVNHCISHYYHIAQINPGTSLETLAPLLIDDLVEQRRQFEKILALREPMKNRDTKLLPAYLWCNRRNISVEHGWRSIYIATGEQLNGLAGFQMESKGFSDDFYAVFPYFKNRHTYASLHVHSLEEDHVDVIPVNPCKHAYWGLHACMPDTREIRLYGNPMTAASYYSTSMSQGHFLVGHVHIAYNPTTDDNPFILDHAIFIRAANTDIDEIIKAKPAVGSLSVADYKPGDTPKFLKESSLDWKPYLMAEFAAVTAKHGLDSAEFAGLVSNIKNETELCNSIIRLLEDQDCRDVLHQFKTKLNAHQFYEVGNIHISETKNGYTARKIGSAIGVPFTNFIIKIDNNVWFEEDPTTRMHCGRVLMQDQEFPVVIPERIVNRPSEIPAAAFNAVMKSPNPDMGIYPQILDSSLQKKLPDIIRKQAANKPTLKGIKRLGWNDGRSRFVTPTWEARASGIYATSRIPFVNSEFLGHYDFSDYSVTPSFNRVGKQICYFLATLASGIVRSYLHMALPPVYLLRNAASITLLYALFKPFGQYQPLAFGSTRRNVLDLLNPANVSGYPVFGYAVDPDIMYGLHHPVVLLSDSGLPYHETLDDESFAEAASYSHFITTRLVTFCLQNTHQVHGMIHSEDEPKMGEMVCEGKQIIEQACGISNFDIFEADMPHLQSMLSEIPFDRINEFFRYDMPTGKVYIRFRKLPGHSRNSIYLELYAKNQEVKQHGNYYLECPVDFITDLLNRFFGRPVRLFHQVQEVQEVKEELGGSAQSRS